MLQYLMNNKILKYSLILCISSFLIGCSSKKATITAYSNTSMDYKKIQDIDLKFNTSELLVNSFESKIPVSILNSSVLNINPSSPTLLEITELDKYTTSQSNEYKYVDYGYKRKSKKSKYPRYTEYCLNTTYKLKVNLKATQYDSIFLNKNFTVSKVETQCRNNKLQAREHFAYKDMISTQNIQQNNITNAKTVIINNNYNNSFNAISYNLNNSLNTIRDIQSSSMRSYYHLLVDKVTSRMIRYMTPQLNIYRVELIEDMDIELTSKEEDEYEALLDEIEKSSSSYIENKLLTMSSKYSTSYVMNYNIGVYYEKRAQYENSLDYYNRALKLQTTQEVLNRLKVVRNNKINLNNIKNSFDKIESNK